MFRLRKIHPPYGTEVTPVWEPAYSEQVKVVSGLCEVRETATRDYLLNLGYELVVPPSEQSLLAKHTDKPKRQKDR